jgi:cellobiose phosphorylase
MIYKFIDDNGTFVVDNPQQYNLYLPLTNRDGSLLSSISPNLAGDIKKDNDRFLTAPASIEDLRSNYLCRREFYLKTDRQILRLSSCYRDTLEIGLLYQKLIKDTGSLQIEITNFIPHNLAAEVMWVRVINKSDKPVDFIPTSCIPLYGRSEKNLRDHRHVTSLLNRIELDKYGILLQPTMVFDEQGHRKNKTVYYVLGYEDAGRPPVGQFPTLDYFLGGRDFILPQAITGKIKPVNRKSAGFDGKEACAAFRFRQRRLEKNEEANYFLIMGIEEDAQRLRKAFFKLNSAQKVRKSLEETKKYWRNYLRQLELDFKDRDFNNWLLWVKLQPVLRKLFGCSFLPHFDYGKGGRGWRDLWQDALALLLTEPEKAKEIIFHNFKGVRIDGSNATIITKEGEFIADRNRISRVWMDHGVWPYLTTRLYIHKTADLNFLLREATYFCDHRLKRAREINANFSQPDYLLRARNKKVYRGSILEHLLVENLVQFFNVGRHNIIRLEGADWNDGLDMASAHGESVAFSFMYAHNLADICVFLERLKEKTRTVAILKELMLLLDRLQKPVDYRDYRQKQARLEEYFQKTKAVSAEKVMVGVEDLIRDLQEKSAHLFFWLKPKEWLKEGFFNGYYDNRGKRVEGRLGDSLRMMLASQVFAMLSGAADKEQIRRAWISINKYLKDERLGGFHLNTDFHSLYTDLGRAFGFSYGDKENGAFFNHMTVMLANALYKRGLAKEGHSAFESVYRMASGEKAGIYPMIPEYFNAEGRGLYLYLTGSASWYVYTLMEEVLGIKFFLGDIRLEPKLLPDNFTGKSIEVKFNLSRKKVKVVFIRRGTAGGVYRPKEVFLDRERVPLYNYSCTVKRKALKNKENTVTVYLEGD